MLMEAKNTINFIIKSLICNIKSSMEYKKSFVLQTIFMMMNNGFFLIFWGVVFGINNGNISGITINDILYLWSIIIDNSVCDNSLPFSNLYLSSRGQCTGQNILF